MRKVLNSLAFSLILSSIIFAPDFILKLFTEAAQAQMERRYVRVIMLLCLGLSFTRNRSIFIGALGFFFVLEFIELHHLAYFGLPLHPMNIDKVFGEWQEVLTTGIPYIKDIYFVSLILIACYGLAIWLFEKCRRHLYSFPYLFPILVMFGLLRAVIPVYNGQKMLIEYYCPAISRPSLYNISSSCYYYLANKIRGNKLAEINWRKYEVTKLDHKAKNIVFVVGESLRYDHLSLYGYERPTTPFLDSIKDDNNFIYKKAISGATHTRGAIPMLLDLIEEPGNLESLYHKPTSLFRLAKENGYKTFLITAQEMTSLVNIGNQYIDYTFDKDDLGDAKYDKMIDDMLPFYARKLDLGEYNFIILHQRNAHSPYEGNYKHHGDQFMKYSLDSLDRKTRMVNSYDNAVMYYDYNIEEIFNYFTETFRDKGESYLIFTSDHGELFGECGLFGHAMFLDVNVAQVPFWLYGLNKDEDFWHTFPAKQKFYTHFEIGKIVADRLGYKVTNPNTHDDTGYICNSLEDERFIKYKRNDDGSIATWRIGNMSEFIKVEIDGEDEDDKRR